MRKVLAIGWVNTIRFLRDRTSLFFVFVFPMMIILLFGMAFGSGFGAKIGVRVDGAGGPLAEAFVQELSGLQDIDVVRYDQAGAMLDAVQRGQIDAAVTLPADYDTGLAAGQVVQVGFLARPDQTAVLLRESVVEVVADQGRPVRAARFVAETGAAGFDEALPVARVVSAASDLVTVTTREAGKPLFEGIENLGEFGLGATQELVLFMFLTSLAGSAALIQTRRLGVARRMLSTPSPTAVILGGEAAGRYSVAVIQGLYIMLGTLLLFHVHWGDPIGAIVVVVVFALVGTGAAMLMGALFSNDQQASGLGVLIGLGLAAFGGAMAPVEIFPATMQTIAKVTPHYWAISAFSELIRHQGNLFGILPQLGVLAAYAAFFLVLATWRLHRVLTR
jgi:ABC-2 type transport system permease protein